VTHLHPSIAAIFGAAILVALAIPATAAAPPVPPTNESLGFTGLGRDEVLAQCKRVGLIPIAKPPLFGVEPEASARIEAAATRALQAAGLEVVGPETYTKAYDRFNKAIGGIYDPFTGAARKDAYSNVYQNAVREFFTQEQLGCVALVRVLTVRANTANKFATWDGAEEYVDGQANGAFARFMFGNNGTGALGALSIRLQLYSRESKVLFGRDGGVQLTSYYDHLHAEQNSDFLRVPRAKWLQDDKRIERALTCATVPLRYSREQIAAGDKDPAINTLAVAPSSLPQPPAGSTGKEESPLLVPREQILGSVHTVVLGPLLSNAPAPPADVATRYRTLVHERLAKLGWNVVESDQLNAAFGAAIKQMGGLYDPMTGKSDPDRVRLLTQTAMKSLSLTANPDAIAFISLVKNSVIQKYSNVDWDGAQQNALTLGPVINRGSLFGGTVNAAAGEGGIEALSLQFLLRDSTGTIVYQARGGIQLAQQLNLLTERNYSTISYKQNYTNLAPSELFKDPDRDVHAVDVALRELVFSPEEIAAQEAAKLKAAGTKH
jgi:hypothetical protein